MNGFKTNKPWIKSEALILIYIIYWSSHNALLR